MKKTAVIAFFLLGLGLTQPSIAATLEEAKWPTGEKCETCFHIQVRNLEFQLPLNQVHGVFSTGVGGNGIEIVPASSTLANTVYVFDRTQDELFTSFKQGGFLKSHDIHTLEEFFESLGREPKPSDASLKKVRAIHGLDSATSYRRMRRDGLTAFVITSVNPEAQRIFFVLDKKKAYYEVAGNLSPEIIQSLLSSARIAEMP